MAFSRPDRSEIVARGLADIESELQNGASRIPGTLERAVAIAQAGHAHSLHGHIDFIARQILPDTAEEEFLVRQAEIWLGENGRKPASKASFTILVSGDVAEAPIAAGTRWTRADGVTFESLESASLSGSAPFQASITVQAVDAGQAGNTIPGTTLRLESPVDDVEAEASVEGEGSTPVGGGADLERIEDLADRLIEHIQTPPRGGSQGDYTRWAKEVSGVSRAWEFPLAMGPGTVALLFVQDTFDADGFYSGTVLPNEEQREEVLEYIAERGPLTVVAANVHGDRNLHVLQVTSLALDPSIRLAPNTSATRQAVTRQLQDLLLREAEPGKTLFRWQITQAVSLATGVDHHIIDSPAGDVTPGPTQLLLLGTPTYSDV